MKKLNSHKDKKIKPMGMDGLGHHWLTWGGDETLVWNALCKTHWIWLPRVTLRYQRTPVPGSDLSYSLLLECSSSEISKSDSLLSFKFLLVGQHTQEAFSGHPPHSRNTTQVFFSGITQFHLPNKIIPSLDHLRYTFSYKHNCLSFLLENSSWKSEALSTSICATFLVSRRV